MLNWNYDKKNKLFVKFILKQDLYLICGIHNINSYVIFIKPFCLFETKYYTKIYSKIIIDFSKQDI